MNRSEEITRELIKNFDFTNFITPSSFIRQTWSMYEENYESNQSLNGAVFENLVSYILAYCGIKNIHQQAEICFVPNAIFDIFLYHSKQPYALSLKTTLRERWKQADLEAYALKNVFKTAKCYVLTLSESEVMARRRKYENGEDFYNGLDGFVLANTEEFDDLVEELKTYDFKPSERISIVVTENECQNLEDLDDLLALNRDDSFDL